MSSSFSLLLLFSFFSFSLCTDSNASADATVANLDPLIDWSQFDYDFLEKQAEMEHHFGRRGGFPPEQYYLPFGALKRALYAHHPDARQTIFVPHISFFFLPQELREKDAFLLQSFLDYLGLLDGESFVTDVGFQLSNALRAEMPSQSDLFFYASTYFSKFQNQLQNFELSHGGQQVEKEKEVNVKVAHLAFARFFMPHLMAAFHYAYPDEFEAALEKAVSLKRTTQTVYHKMKEKFNTVLKKTTSLKQTALATSFEKKGEIGNIFKGKSACKAAAATAVLFGGLFYLAYQFGSFNNGTENRTLLEGENFTTTENILNYWNDQFQEFGLYIGAASLCVAILASFVYYYYCCSKGRKGKRGGHIRDANRNPLNADNKV